MFFFIYFIFKTYTQLKFIKTYYLRIYLSLVGVMQPLDVFFAVGIHRTNLFYVILWRFYQDEIWGKYCILGRYTTKGRTDDHNN